MIKVCFHGAREQFAKDVNVRKMAKSNIRILGSKSSPNMPVGLDFFGSVVNCSRDAGNVRKKCQTFEIPTELKTTPVNN